MKLCSTFATLYSDDLDRKALWERIGNGLVVCSAKSGGSVEKFVDTMLDYVKASPGKVASSKALENFVDMMAVRPKEWHEVFLRYCEEKHFILIVKARALWNSQKKVRVKDDSFDDLDTMHTLGE